jgi:hypothetical protein
VCCDFPPEPFGIDEVLIEVVGGPRRYRGLRKLSGSAIARS